MFRGFTILSNLIEDSLANLFLQGFAKKELANLEEGLENFAVDAGLDVIGNKVKKGLLSIIGCSKKH